LRKEKVVHTTFNNSQVPYVVLGFGVDIPKVVKSDLSLKKYSICSGRIDTGKLG
jgi:hypothetical protein